MQKKCLKNTLAGAKIGARYVICGFAQVLDIKYMRRLLEFGFLRGASIWLVKKSMCQKAFLVKTVDGYFTLRDEIAKSVFVRCA